MDGPIISERVRVSWRHFLKSQPTVETELSSQVQKQGDLPSPSLEDHGFGWEKHPRFQQPGDRIRLYDNSNAATKFGSRIFRDFNFYSENINLEEQRAYFA